MSPSRFQSLFYKIIQTCLRNFVSQLCHYGVLIKNSLLMSFETGQDKTDAITHLKVQVHFDRCNLTRTLRYH